ncbi:hypothetical protein BJ508DRAFT_326819 [Ascobolus immersus RN42]|uniref:DDE Tnp4 domain-containing protein n=1 Tax=Ascobolus immersus RN42 TaxID=1160509 RepID=A0A3N4IA10_ASCIM|nr:hypothetical protein BJ508DRAFT_326819 [Ascobolus immersus RN42]
MDERRAIIFRGLRRLRKQRKRKEQQPNYVPPIPYVHKLVWSIKEEGWSDRECLEYLRFTSSEIERLLSAFQLDTIEWRFRNTPTPEEALCLLLFRLSHPHRLKDCMRTFGKSRSWCSAVFNDMSDFITTKYKERLEWDGERLDIPCLTRYASAIEDACGASRIWGFIDGGVARPVHNQQFLYAGAKKEHGIRFQGITTPDGLISSLCGPWLGPTGDWKIWRESGVEDHLRALMDPLPEEERLFLYGDPAYYPGYGIMGPFRPEGDEDLTPDEEAANIVMSGQRIVVEWSFGHVSKYWTFTSFKRCNKSGSSPVAAYYICAVLFTNIHTCLRGRNQISDKYKLSPPSIEVYLGI